MQGVALHPEGVDRNTKTPLLSKICPEVALHPEGVDRNALVGEGGVQCYGSPSTRKAWIEILFSDYSILGICVALHPEGVDRNAVA